MKESPEVKHAPDRQTQCRMILAYLENGGTLSQNDATRLFRCTRLAARIYDLKRRGHKIIAVRMPHKGGTYARYELEAA